MAEIKNIVFAKVTSGKLHQYLKDVEILGRVTKDEEFIIYGCKIKDERKFYQGILNYDKSVGIQGFETIKEVEKYWLEHGEIILYLKKGEFTVTENIEEVE